MNQFGDNMAVSDLIKTDTSVSWRHVWLIIFESYREAGLPWIHELDCDCGSCDFATAVVWRRDFGLLITVRYCVDTVFVGWFDYSFVVPEFEYFFTIFINYFSILSSDLVFIYDCYFSYLFVYDYTQTVMIQEIIIFVVLCVSFDCWFLLIISIFKTIRFWSCWNEVIDCFAW